MHGCAGFVMIGSMPRRLLLLQLVILVGRHYSAAAAARTAPLLVGHYASGLLELRLNRAAALNALNGELVDELMAQVLRAHSDESVTSVLLSAEPGRAFCAGGDIKAAAAVPIEEARDFLQREYELMLSLHTLNQLKPVVALADGYVIGAGAGLFMSAGTRVASRSSSFSMPEAVLGIVPDVGATDFLFSSDRGFSVEVGRWAGLTGARLDCSLMMAAGLATHLFSGSQEEDSSNTEAADDAIAGGGGVEGLRARLIDAGESSESIDAALAAEAAACAEEAASPEVAARLSKLEVAAARVFGGCGGDAAASDAPSVALEQLDAKLEAEEATAAETGDEAMARWAADARQKLARGCPAALLVAHECWQARLVEDDEDEDEPSARRASALGVELVANQLLAARPDFQQGVACAVGGKRGEAPQWEHASIEEAANDPGVEAILEQVRGAKRLGVHPLLHPALGSGGTSSAGV